MLLGKIFNLRMSEWEEKIAAAAFLAGANIPDEAFDGAAAMRCGLERLEQLPPSWARELCIEVVRRTPA